MNKTAVKYLIAVIVIAGLFAVTTKGAFALGPYSTAQIDALLPTGTQTAVGWDSGYCRTNLQNNAAINDPFFPNLRDSINGNGPYKAVSYADLAWLSDVGKPNVQTPTPVNWGQKSIPLQINNASFLCATLVSPETWGPSPPLPKNPYSMDLYNQWWRWVLSSGNANDRPPNPVGSSNMRPARYDMRTLITGFTVTNRPGAFMSGGVGAVQALSRDNNSRYWFGNRVPVTYNDPTGIINKVTVTITMDYQQIMGYHAPPGVSGRVEVCAGKAPAIYPSSLAFGGCGVLSTSLTITFVPAASLSATSIVTPPQVSLGGVAKFTHYITKTGLANANYWWRLCGGYSAGKDLYPGAPCTGYSAAANSFSTVHNFLAADPSKAGMYYCERIVYAVTPGAGDVGTSQAACTQVITSVASCNVSVTPAIDPFTTFTVTVNGTNTANSTAPTDSVTLSIVPVPGNGTTWTYPATTRPTGAAYPVALAFGPLGPTGQTGQWTIQATYRHFGAVDVPCQISPGVWPILNVANEPYLQVYGGDVSAGTAVTDNGGSQQCSTNPNPLNQSGVYSWNNHSTDYSGAGSQYAVLALGQILDFASASGSSPPTGLSFANKGLLLSKLDPSQGLFGGYLGATTTACDFTSDVKVAPTVAPLTLNTTVVPKGASQVHYVKGADVFITGTGITYDTAGWISTTDIPYFKLVVTGGNIYIGPNVTQLDGIYVAEKAGGVGGTIFTCASGLGVPIVPTSFGTYFNQCHQKLTINGAFAAQQVRFLRSFGTLGQAKSGDAWQSNTAAEVFNYSPEVWLPRGGGLNLNPKYDAVTGLPPVL